MSLRLRRGIALIAFCAAVVGLGAGPASRWWSKHRRQTCETECRAAREAGDWDGLRELAEAWSKWEPSSSTPWLFLAEAEEGRGDRRAMAAALLRIPETDPKALPAFVELAQLQFGVLNQPFEGEATCQQLLRLEPRTAFAHQRLIQYYALSLQREKLVKQIRFAVDQKREPPEAYVYLMLLDSLRLNNGVKFNEIWLESHPDEEVFLVARAIQMLDVPDEQASAAPDERDTPRRASAGKLKLVERLLDKYPENLELLAYTIEHSISTGQTDRVIDLLSRAPEPAERDSRYWRFKGWVHETLDELPDAEAAYKQALDISPLDWNARNRLAIVYRRRQHPAEVERLAALVEQARQLRIRIRKLPAAELVTPEILAELKDYAEKCGVDWLVEALDRRSNQVPSGSVP
jgi:tetratricopeptide (TPR) repeat protein